MLRICLGLTPDPLPVVSTTFSIMTTLSQITALATLLVPSYLSLLLPWLKLNMPPSLSMAGKVQCCALFSITLATHKNAHPSTVTMHAQLELQLTKSAPNDLKASTCNFIGYVIGSAKTSIPLFGQKAPTILLIFHQATSCYYTPFTHASFSPFTTSITQLIMSCLTWYFFRNFTSIERVCWHYLARMCSYSFMSKHTDLHIYL